MRPPSPPPPSAIDERQDSPDRDPLRRVEEPVSILPGTSDVVTEIPRFITRPHPVTQVRWQIVPEARVIQERQAADTTDLFDPFIPHLPPVGIRVQFPGRKPFLAGSIVVEHDRLMQRDTPFSADIREVAMDCLEDQPGLLPSGVVPGCLVVVHRRAWNPPADSSPLHPGQQRPRCPLKPFP